MLGGMTIASMTPEHIVNLNINGTRLNILILTSCVFAALMTSMIKFILFQFLICRRQVFLNCFKNLFMCKENPEKIKYVTFIYSGTFLTIIRLPGVSSDSSLLLPVCLLLVCCCLFVCGLSLYLLLLYTCLSLLLSKQLFLAQKVAFLSLSYTSLKPCYRR